MKQTHTVPVLNIVEPRMVHVYMWSAGTIPPGCAVGTKAGGVAAWPCRAVRRGAYTDRPDHTRKGLAPAPETFYNARMDAMIQSLSHGRCHRTTHNWP